MEGMSKRLKPDETTWRPGGPGKPPRWYLREQKKKEAEQKERRKERRRTSAAKRTTRPSSGAHQVEREGAPEASPAAPPSSGPPPPSPAAPGSPGNVPNPFAAPPPPAAPGAPPLPASLAGAVPGAPAAVEPWEDPKRLAPLKAPAGMVLYYAIYRLCERSGRMPPTRQAVDALGLSEAAAATFIAWFPDLEPSGKWSLTFALGFAVWGLIQGQPPLRPAEPAPARGEEQHAPSGA
jgi:hypothetical protein